MEPPWFSVAGAGMGIAGRGVCTRGKGHDVAAEQVARIRQTDLQNFVFKAVLGNPKLGRKSWSSGDIHQLGFDDVFAKVA